MKVLTDLAKFWRSQKVGSKRGFNAPFVLLGFNSENFKWLVMLKKIRKLFETYIYGGWEDFKAHTKTKEWNSDMEQGGWGGLSE